ncbi:MAG: OadG family transporter subunit [Calditrichaceae bacterium]
MSYSLKIVLLSAGSAEWIQKIVEGNGLLISVIGMTIVFSGLLLISLSIRLLTKLDSNNIGDDENETIGISALSDEENNSVSEEVIIAITTAISLCHSYVEGEKQRLTWEDDSYEQSPWSVSGIVQGVTQRSNISTMKGQTNA